MPDLGKMFQNIGRSFVNNTVSSITNSASPTISTVMTGINNPTSLISNFTGYSPGLNLNTGTPIDGFLNGIGGGNNGTSMNFTPSSVPEYSDQAFASNVDGNYLGAITGLTGDENVMSTVDTPTFHLTLSIASPFDPSKEYVICESGMTGFTWMEMVIEDYIGPDYKTRNLGCKTFTMRIHETLGMSMYDRIVNASAALGISNFTQVPYHLKIKFGGWDKDTGEAVWFKDYNKIYRIYLLSNETTLNETGSIHTLKGNDFPDQASADLYAIVQDSIRLNTPEQRTVGQILQDVIAKLNADVIKREKKPLTVYQIEDRPYSVSSIAGFGVSSPFEHKVGPDDPNKHNARNRENIHIGRGMDIGMLVDQLMANSPSASKMIGDPAAYQNGSKDQEVKPSYMLHRIRTEVKLGGYDSASGQYYKTITYILVGYESYSLIGNPESYNLSSSQGGEAQLERFNRFTQANRFKKVYDYLFTGLNTEVVGFDFKTKFNFILLQDTFKGMMDYNGYTAGPELNEQRQRIDQISQGGAGSGSESPPAFDGEVVDQDQNNRTAEGLRGDNLLSVPVPAPIHQSGGKPGNNTNLTVEGQANGNRSFYAMMLNQFHRRPDDNFQDITIDIRGDPYWFGKSAIEDQANPTMSDGQVADFMTGEHCFLLRVNLPQGMNPNHDPILMHSTKFSGFFGVRQVTHTFRDGVFTQTLHAHRLPLWSLAGGNGSSGGSTGGGNTNAVSTPTNDFFFDSSKITSNSNSSTILPIAPGRSI